MNIAMKRFTKEIERKVEKTGNRVKSLTDAYEKDRITESHSFSITHTQTHIRSLFKHSLLANNFKRLATGINLLSFEAR